MSDATIPAQPEPDPNAIAQPDPAPAPEGAPAADPVTAPSEDTATQPAAAEIVATPTEPDPAAHPSGHPDGTIVKTVEGFFEKIVHEAEGLWHKEPVNEDGSPVPTDAGVETEDITAAPEEPFGHLPEGGDAAAPTQEG